MEDSKQAFGEAIRIAREAKGISQRALAHQLGVSNTIVADWEKGKWKPSLSNFTRLALALDMSEEGT